MNLYFLVEGQTEKKVYPQWLQHLLPNFSRVSFADMAKENNYYLISGGGYPCILNNHLRNSIEEVNDCHLYDKLILVIDADELTVYDKIREVEQFIATEKIILNTSCQLHIIAQKYCMETWFLGNQKVHTRNPSIHSDFYHHARFYDVSQYDPELMGKPSAFNASTSQYHAAYCKKMLAEKKLSYDKAEPIEIGESHYVEQLKKRVSKTSHLPSLNNFFSFCESISISR